MKRIINLLLGRGSIPLSFERNLSQYGGEKIKNIAICRQPIQSVIQTVLNQASGGDLEKNIKQKGYDELYHLFSIITTESGDRFRLEKNQRPVFEVDSTSNPEDCVYVEKYIGVSLRYFIERAISSMGVDRFVKYDPFKNNCQDFLLRVLSSNGLLSEEIRKFIKQDAEDLLSPAIQEASKTITDIAGVVSDITDIYEENKDEPIVKTVEEILKPIKQKGQSWFQSLTDMFIKGVEDVFGGLGHKGSNEPDLISALHKESAPSSRLTPENVLPNEETVSPLEAQ